MFPDKTQETSWQNFFNPEFSPRYSVHVQCRGLECNLQPANTKCCIHSICGTCLLWEMFLKMWINSYCPILITTIIIWIKSALLFFFLNKKKNRPWIWCFPGWLSSESNNGGSSRFERTHRGQPGFPHRSVCCSPSLQPFGGLVPSAAQARMCFLQTGLYRFRFLQLNI